MYLHYTKSHQTAQADFSSKPNPHVSKDENGKGSEDEVGYNRYYFRFKGLVFQKPRITPRWSRSRLTSLSNDNSLQLALTEASPINHHIPRTIERFALNDPENRQNDIAHDQTCNESLNGPNERLVDCESQKEEANRDFRKHERRKRLQPLAIRIFLSLNVLPFGEIVSMPAESVMHLYNDQAR